MESPSASVRLPAPTAPPADLGRWARAVGGFGAASLAGLLPVYAKWQFLQASGSGFLAISRLSGGTIEADLGWLTRLSFLAWDLLVSLLVLPLAVALLAYLLPRRLALAAITLYCVASALWVFAAMVTMSNVGRFPSPDMLADGVGWVREHPDFLGKYVSDRARAKLGLLLGLCVAAYLVGTRWARRSPSRGGVGRFLASEATLVIAGVALLLIGTGASAWRFRQSLPYQYLAAAEFVSDLRFGNGGGSSDALRDPGIALTLTGSCVAPAPLRAAAPGADLIVVVLESASARAMEGALAKGVLPGFARAAERALVASQHFTTHPYSSDAVFSILTGRYPTGRRERLERDDWPMDDAIGALLQRAGYQTGLYVPFLDRPGMDQRMYAMTGIQRLFVSAAHPTQVDSVLAGGPMDPRGARMWPGTGLLGDPDAMRRLAQDRLAFGRMLTDIERFKSAGQRFATFILPQVGHGPWADEGRTPLQGSMSRLTLQDQWVQALLDLLESRGWSDSTVLVITSDHGVRTRTEDAAIEPGRVSDYTFQVPLIVSAPGVLEARHVIPHATSHVDLLATMADLLGLPRQADAAQGQPIWCPPSEHRDILLIAEDYFGVNAILTGSTCLAYSPMTDLVSPCLGIGRPPAAADADGEPQVRHKLRSAQRAVRRMNLDHDPPPD